MDQIKIGRFIAKLRKEKKLTQANLAEKLGISDRAVSKWECGKSLPDASIMLELCSILSITVNELLYGERIEMDDYNKKTEELILEMKKSEEEKNKSLISAMYIIYSIGIIALISILALIYFLMEPGTTQTLFAIGAVIIICIPLLIGFRLEVNAGYYKCKNCGHKFTVNYGKALVAPHLNTTRFLKCPECNKRSWCKKTMIK